MMGAFRQWWIDREPRERWLLGTAAILSLVVVAYQFILVPTAGFRADQKRAFSSALSEYAYVSAATRSVTARQSVPTRNRPLQAVLTNTSDLFGLTISRLAPAERDGLNVWFDSVSPELLYAWLGELEREHAVRVERAAIRRNPDSEDVNANLFLLRAD